MVVWSPRAPMTLGCTAGSRPCGRLRQMRVPGLLLAVLFVGSTCTAATENTVFRERRARAAAAFADGILLLHANSALDITADGFRQDALFYYFTGLENTVAGILAIDAKAGETWLFLPSNPPFLKSGLKPE